MKESVLEAVTWLQQVTPTQWELYGEMALPLVSAGISAFFMFMKRLFEINRPIFMFFIVALVSSVTGMGLYLLDVVNGNPFIASILYPLVTVMAYHFALKPLV